MYDTCPHGCIYCYANMNKERSVLKHARHDPESAFLGYTKAESDGFLQDLRSRPAADAKAGANGEQDAEV